MVIDTATMFYFHREGAGVLMGMPRLADAVATYETVVDDRWIAEELLPTAVSVLPALESAGLARSWVGLYEMTPDRHAILGPVEGLGGLYLAVGFSGHGFQHAPIVGTVIAELITGRSADGRCLRALPGALRPWRADRRVARRLGATSCRLAIPSFGSSSTSPSSRPGPRGGSRDRNP